jgi:hypothetical protein
LDAQPARSKIGAIANCLKNIIWFILLETPRRVIGSISLYL